MTPIRNITFGFDEAEDRIVLRCLFSESAAMGLQLTRRMAGPLLERLAQILVETSNVAATLPIRLKEDVMMMEHAHALAKVSEQSAQAAPMEMPSEQKALAHCLLTRIDIQRQPEQCTLLFFCNHSETALAAVAFSRVQLHWFVDTLDRFAQRAAWEFKPPMRGWLALRDETAASSGMAVLH